MERRHRSITLEAFIRAVVAVDSGGLEIGYILVSTTLLIKVPGSEAKCSLARISQKSDFERKK